MDMLVIPCIESIKDGCTIDMSKHNFDENIDPIHASLIFLRNIDIPVHLDFSNCSYYQKKQYIQQYMFSNIDVDIPELSATWVDVLLYKTNHMINPIGFLNNDELSQFIIEFWREISKVSQLVASMPVLALYTYINAKPELKEIIRFDNQFPINDDNSINYHNFASIVHHKRFTYVNVSKYKPMMYPHYFSQQQYDYLNDDLNNNLPYMALLNVMLASNDIQMSFIDRLNKMLDNKEMK